MSRKLLPIIVVILLFCAEPSYAQFGRMFTPDDILSNSLVNDIVQDQKGFIWIATQDGLNRYDGYRMTVFHEGDGSKLADNTIICMYVANDGTIYIGTGGGAQRYNPASGGFDILQPTDTTISRHAYINAISPLPDGDIAFATSGYGVLRLKSGSQQLTSMPQPAGNYVRHIFEDTKGRIWVTSQNDGIFMQTKQGNEKARFFTNGQRALILKTMEDHQGNIYAVSMTNGLYKYNASEGTFSHIAASADIAVADIKLQDDGKFCIGSDGDGLIIYDPMTNSVVHNPKYIDDTDLSRAKIHALLRDRDGNFWFGLFQKGVLLSPNIKSGFKYIGHKSARTNEIGNYCVMALYRDNKGYLWVGTDNDGIYRLDPKGHNTVHYKNPSTVLSIAEDGNGDIWVGTYKEGCGTLNPTTGQYQRLQLPEQVAPAIFSIKTDQKGNLWMATLGSGLLYYDIHTRQHQLFASSLGNKVNAKENKIPNNYPLALTWARNGQTLWISTCDGVAAYDTQRHSFTSQFGRNIILEGASVNHIYEDQKGTLWVGTSNGLYALNGKGQQQARYTTHNGLTNNGVRCIIGDKSGNIWLGTSRGLSKLDTDRHFTNYSTGNGLQGNEFSDRAVLNISDSIIVFGGSNGITYFRPNLLNQHKHEIKVYLTGMTTHDQAITAGMKSGIYTVTDKPVIDADHFELSHQHNSIKLQFSAMEFCSPDQVVYEYAINGGEWNTTSPGQSEINFSHLGAGTYRFQVRARSTGNVSEPLQFTIVVHPAWYASGWFRVILVMLAVGMLFFYLHNRSRQEQQRLRLLQHIHAEEMSEAKLRFFMNISHEIRTPMTLIVTPLQSLIKNDHDPERRGIYETISRNAERILSLINQMMDLRKIDKGQMQMHMRETDLVGFIDDLHKLFAQQAQSRQITLTFNHEDEHLTAWVDRRHFDKVIVNILSNAFKYTHNGGEITINMTHDERNVSIAISDNGEKIPEDKLDKVFERFYQTTSAVNDRHSGTGIGLDLTRSLVELHHGTITAHNLSQGCEFVVSIPLGREHLNPEELLETKEQTETTLLTVEPDITEEPQPEAVVSTGAKPRLVIAEDDDEIRQFLTQQLSQNYEVTACSNGHEALGEVYRSGADLVISDVMMPVMDGNELCSKLKTNTSTHHIPVIMLTAKSRDEDKLEGLATGADAYLVKPFNMEILQRTITNLISTRRMLRLKYERNDAMEQMVDELKVTSPDEKLLQRVMNSINKHLDDADLSVDMIADEVGLSRVHLYRKLKELTGQTPRDFVRNIRLKRAATLLSQQSMNVTEVMYACGFSNLASFSNIFKKYFGMSPSEYAKEHSST